MVLRLDIISCLRICIASGHDFEGALDCCMIDGKLILKYLFIWTVFYRFSCPDISAASNSVMTDLQLPLFGTSIL